MLEWFIVIVLIALIVYLVIKYEKRIKTLQQKIEKNSEAIRANRDGITKNSQSLELNQTLLEKLKD